MKYTLGKMAWCAALLLMGVAACPSAASHDAPGRLANPYVGAKSYVNSKWRAHVLAEPGGAAIANESTAIWLDNIADISPLDKRKWGLADYLDDALAQKANLVTIVLYDLPNRDCAALASSGELHIAQNGFERYKYDYIIPIAGILAKPRYSQLRIVVIIEPDSLPNLVTNLAVPACKEAAGPGGYVESIQFALNMLYPVRNVYSYLDIGHSGWMGWDGNLAAAAMLVGQTIKGTDHGVQSVAGFITNTANYTPLHEPWLGDYEMDKLPGSATQFVRQARFYGWNPYFGEIDYARAFRAKMIGQGFPQTIGMLIDTSRNGWGGPGRPKRLSRAADLNQFVDDSRIDRRTHRGMWCNQPGGIGERPRANPVPGIAAYVWIKPPGESDGVASAGIPDPTDPAKRFDRYCDPAYIPPETNGEPTGAMAGAPHAGEWFSAGFRMLMENAWPPLKQKVSSSH